MDETVEDQETTHTAKWEAMLGQLREEDRSRRAQETAEEWEAIGLSEGESKTELGGNDRENKTELGELKKQLMSKKLGLSKGESKTELGGNDGENKTDLGELKKWQRSERLACYYM